MCYVIAFFSPGPMEMVIIAAIALLLFGNRLPGAMRSLGSGIVEFKKGMRGIEEEVEHASVPPAKEAVLKRE